MQCPICGSDRKPEYTKCPTCGVDFSKWLNKIINKLNKKKNTVMQNTKSMKNNEQTEQPQKSEPNRYKEVIKQE